MTNAIVETVECSRCSEPMQLHATLVFEDDSEEESYLLLCPMCFEIAKKNDGSRCVCCDVELVESGG